MLRDAATTRASGLTLTLTLALLALPAASAACPDCATGRAARASVFDRDFGRHLAMTLAPFAVVATVTAAVYRGGRRSRPRDDDA